MRDVTLSCSQRMLSYEKVRKNNGIIASDRKRKARSFPLLTCGKSVGRFYDDEYN